MHNGENIESDLFILSSTKRNIADQTKIKFIKRDLEQEALSISVKGEIKNKSYAFQNSPDGPLRTLIHKIKPRMVIKERSKIF